MPQGYTTSLVPTAGQDLGTAAAVVNATGIAALGAKLVSATLSVRGVFGNPTPGAYRWRALATPYTPNSDGSVEIQAFDAIPVGLTLAARVDHRLNRLRLTGRLRENAVGASVSVIATRSFRLR